MLHNWYKDTDGNGSTMRVMLFDFKKAFGLIDHAILMAKLGDYELPLRVLDWIADFLTDRKQRVKSPMIATPIGDQSGQVYRKGPNWGPGSSWS